VPSRLDLVLLWTVRERGFPVPPTPARAAAVTPGPRRTRDRRLPKGGGALRTPGAPHAPSTAARPWRPQPHPRRTRPVRGSAGRCGGAAAGPAARPTVRVPAPLPAAGRPAGQT